VFHELDFEICDPAGVNLVQISSHTAINDGNLILNGHGDILALFKQFSQPDATVQQLLGTGVKIRSELGEGRDLTVLSQLKLHGTGNLETKMTFKQMENFNFDCEPKILVKI
jgi:hypothetical protein